MKKTILNFVKQQNFKKKLFTPGPASLLSENISSLEPCFGRGDQKYEKIEKEVLKKILSISGQKKIARLQGSASFALEVMISNFLYGKVLIIKTGVYSDRLRYMCETSKLHFRYIREIKYIEFEHLENITEKFDWIIGCPVETSIGFRIPIKDLYKLKKRLKARLALDATASIGLELDHNLADVMGFSSCKGLFGLTGGAFICFNIKKNNEIKPFNFNLTNHLEKKMTGPYHSICSLYEILKNYNDFSYAVKINKKIFLKKMKNFLSYTNYHQPNLCTLINKKIKAKKNNIILYQSRADINGSVVCHLGEVHLKRKAKGKIFDNLILD